MTEKECWMCHRKLNEVIEAGNKIGYSPITDPDNDKEIEKNAMYNVDVLGRKVTICAICRDLTFEVARDSLLEAIHNGLDDVKDDIITYQDLEQMTLEVNFDRPLKRRNKVHSLKRVNRNKNPVKE